MENTQLKNSNFQENDRPENSVRPLNFAEFIGQHVAKRNLNIAIKSAKKRQDVLDHVLLYGPPGLGKTTLAQIIAREMGVNFRATSGPLLTKSGDLAAILTNLQENDVLFIDEIHRLNTAVEEVLYPAMEDFCLDLVIGEGPAARAIRIDLQKFTLVGATTRKGLLSNPLLDRFGIPTKLDFYNEEELCIVVNRGAKILRINLTEEGALEVARRSRGTPRIAIRLLRRVRDFALVEQKEIIDKNIADLALKNLEVDSIGLDGLDHQYLSYIAECYSGGPVGVETVAAGLSEQRDTIEETIEPYLLQIGFLHRTPRGRVLSEKAFKHLGIPVSKKQKELFEYNLINENT